MLIRVNHAIEENAHTHTCLAGAAGKLETGNCGLLSAQMLADAPVRESVSDLGGRALEPSVTKATACIT